MSLKLLTFLRIIIKKLQKQLIIINLTFIISDIVHRLADYQVDKKLKSNSDHKLILTLLSLEIELQSQ